ncbi:MAG: hypothetical protein J7494_07530 [Sphingobium sp.]|nr:hypothetical protein [Sphingobium sp.]
MKQAWLKATAICGTLDILYAIVATILRGGSVAGMLTGVASGPLGDAVQSWGLAGAIAGLLVHFALMGVMAAILQQALRNDRIAGPPFWLVGAVYGIGLYLVMYGIVLPARFGASFPPATLGRLANGLVPHIFLVGIPMAWILRKQPTA